MVEISSLVEGPKMRANLKHFLFIAFIAIVAVLSGSMLFAEGQFEATSNGVLYVVRDGEGQVVQALRPQYDPASGKYLVRDEDQQVIAQQALPAEARMAQIKIVAPVDGSTHNVTTKDFLGNTVPVLKELPTSDPRYQQLRNYINNDPGLKNVVGMQLEARNMKVDSLQRQVAAGTKDPQLAAWLTNDLRKPIYLEVGDSGPIYHDPKGFVLAQQAPGGQVSYRDNSQANRLVIPPNSEAFQGGMNDSAAASVMAHEVGHMIMDQTYETPNYPKTNYAGPHSKDSVTDEGFAISEGWAEAVETMANKDRLNNATSWRVASQKNIADNKYIFKNQGVLEGPNDGILKTGGQQLSTEGVNATLFFKMLTDNHIQAPYSKVLQVFEQTKPQNYREFLSNYVQSYPEDRSYVIKSFLENTKYTTVDPSATARYKDIHDTQLAMESASSPEQRSQLQSEYDAKLGEYNQWKEHLYKQTVVDGQIDKAMGEGGVAASSGSSYSDETNKQYRQVKLSENILRGKKALGVGLERATDSIKQSFSVKNVAMTAGTSIAINLANQVFSGEKVSVKKAFQAVASMQFVGSVVGSSLGAAAGQAIAPLIQAFVPIPIVGALAGTLLPTLISIAGGQFGGNLGAGSTFKEALKALDPVAIAGQGVGSTIGAMLGAMIPIPILGPMLGGIIGGMLGEKLFVGIAKLFGRDKTKARPSPAPATLPAAARPDASVQAADSLPPPSSPKAQDPSYLRIDPSIDSVPLTTMNKDVRDLKARYENTYKLYVAALNSGDQNLVKQRLGEFVPIRDRYRRALSAYIKR